MNFSGQSKLQSELPLLYHNHDVRYKVSKDGVKVGAIENNTAMVITMKDCGLDL